MRWHQTTLSIVVLIWSMEGSLCAQDRSARSDQEALIQLEKQWDAAFLRRDVAFIANILADEFIVTYSDGTTGDKTKELMLTAEFKQMIDSSKLDDFTVRIYGDTALVWFSRHLVGPSQGRLLEVKYRFLDVFVWRGGRWQSVASQSAKVS
jgi:ketosteroid isomerase-like protein